METVLDSIKQKFADKILKTEERSPLRVYIDIRPEHIRELAKGMFTEFDLRLITVTGIDTPSGIEILYHFSDDSSGQIISVRTLISDKKDPHIKSITPIITGAEWIEREIWELLGVHFDGHPNLKHLLLIDEWPEGEFPLRHDHKRDHDKEHTHEP